MTKRLNLFKLINKCNPCRKSHTLLLFSLKQYNLPDLFYPLARQPYPDYYQVIFIASGIFMSSHSLTKLSQRLSQLEQTLQDIMLQPARRARFDTSLFTSHGTRLKDYFTELRFNFTALQHAVEHNQIDSVSFLAERVACQMEALQREQATYRMREQEATYSLVNSNDIYQKLAEHQDYERRLMAMIRAKEQALTQCQILVQQQKIQQELAILTGRITRCRQALASIEKKIERTEQDRA